VYSREIENELVAKIKSIRQRKLFVSYEVIKNLAKETALRLGIQSFKASKGYIQKLCRRNGLGYREPTHKAQATNKSPQQECVSALEFIQKLNKIPPKFAPQNIFNMDQTPYYFDLQHGKTIDDMVRSVDVVHTGNEKSRFTVILTIAASGEMLPAVVLFRGLVKPPKITQRPSNVFLQANQSGIVTTSPMNREPKLLIIDMHSAHLTDPSPPEKPEERSLILSK
jgi:hypothetical protein